MKSGHVSIRLLHVDYGGRRLTSVGLVQAHPNNFYAYQKRTETSLHKKISKKNLADVGMNK